MRALSKSKFGGILVMPVLLAILLVGVSFANVIDGNPGYPNAWEGMTTNAIIRIDLDRPVAMSAGLPDLVYTVKKAGFDGFVFVTTEVMCDVEVSDDRKTIRLYPQGLLEKEAFYAYKLESIAFADGSEQEYTQCYATGSNPVSYLSTAVSELDMCNDDTARLNFSNWCIKCHSAYAAYIDCVIVPE